MGTEPTHLPVFMGGVWNTKSRPFIPFYQYREHFDFSLYPHCVYIASEVFDIQCNGKVYPAVIVIPLSPTLKFIQSGEDVCEYQHNEKKETFLLEKWNEKVVLTMNLAECIVSKVQIRGFYEKFEPEHTFAPPEYVHQFRELERENTAYLSAPFHYFVNASPSLY